MARRVYPDKLPNGVAVLGWDGSDFRVIRVDGDHNLQVDTLSSALPADAATETTLALIEGRLGKSFPVDRDPSDPSIICDGTWGNHATTTRATYTVPADRHALIMSIFGATSLIVPAGLAIIMVDKAGIRLFNMITDNALNYREVNQSMLAQVWAFTGETVVIRTFNNTGGNVVYYATVCIIEFDA